MPWEPIEKPSQEVLDILYSRHLKRMDHCCPDCKVTPGKCETGYGDVWDGMWPGIRECYIRGYVCKWVGEGTLPEGEIAFDLNRLNSTSKRSSMSNEDLPVGLDSGEMSIINNWFTYHTPVGTQPERYQKIRDAAKNMATVIMQCCPDCDDRMTALRMLREANMMANATIACNEKNL